MNKKELNNLILNEIFGFGKKKEEEGEEEVSMPGIISKGSPLYDSNIAKAARGDKKALEALLSASPKDKFQEGEFFDKLNINLDRFEKRIKPRRQKAGSPVAFTTQLSALRKIRGGLIKDKKDLEDLVNKAKLGGDDDFAKVLSVYGKMFMEEDRPRPKAAEPKEEPSPKALPPGETRKALPPGEAPRRLPPGVSPRQLPSDVLTRTFPPPPEGFPTVERFSDFFRRLLNDVRAGERTMEDVKREVGIRGRKIRAAADAARDTEVRRQFQAYMDNINSEFASAFRSVMRESKQKQINSTTQDLEQIIREELENYIKEKK